MNLKVCSMMAAVFSFVTAAAVAQEAAPSGVPVRLAPASPWNVDYADDSCAIMRAFGAEGERVLFELRQTFPGRHVRIMVASEDFTFTRRRPTMRFGEEAELRLYQAQYISGDSGLDGFFKNDVIIPRRSVGRNAAYDYQADRDSREAAITEVLITRALEQNVVLETGSLYPAMVALRECVNDLLTAWGVNLEAFYNPSQPAQPVDRDTWVRQIQNHYPRRGARQDRSPVIEVTVLVGPDGRVAQCQGRNALGNEDFEAVACAGLFEYARFEPALDADGEPTHGLHSTTVVYQLY